MINLGVEYGSVEFKETYVKEGLQYRFKPNATKDRLLDKIAVAESHPLFRQGLVTNGEMIPYVRYALPQAQIDDVDGRSYIVSELERHPGFVDHIKEHALNDPYYQDAFNRMYIQFGDLAAEITK